MKYCVKSGSLTAPGKEKFGFWTLSRRPKHAIANCSPSVIHAATSQIQRKRKIL